MIQTTRSWGSLFVTDQSWSFALSAEAIGGKQVQVRAPATIPPRTYFTSKLRSQTRLKFLHPNIFYSISAVLNKVLLLKNGGLLSAGKSWRGCSRNCHEVSAQNIWPGDCLQEGFQLMTHRLNKVVALKKVPLKRLEDGISEATIREIKALQQLESQFVVK